MRTKKEIAEWMVNNSSMQNESQKAKAVSRIIQLTRYQLDCFVNFIKVNNEHKCDFNFVVHVITGFKVANK